MQHSLPQISYREKSVMTLVCLLSFIHIAMGSVISEEEMINLWKLPQPGLKLKQSIKTLKTKSDNKDVKARLLLSKALLAEGEYEEANKLLLTFNPEVEPRALALLAKQAELKKDLSEKARILEQLKKSQPYSEIVVIELARAYSGTKNAAKAAEVLKERIKKMPNRKPPYFELLDLYEKNKNNYEVRTLLEDMTQKFKGDKEVQSRHCKSTALAGYLDVAADSCEKAVTLDPDFAENHIYLGITRKNLKETEASEKIIKSAAKRFQKNELAQYTAAQLFEEAKNAEVAIRYYRTCVKYNLFSDKCHRGLANTSFQLGLYEEALKSYALSCHRDSQARVEFRNALTKLRNQMKTAVADEYQKKFEKCGLTDSSEM